eukprot:COSAG05_NODE_7314_length_829_cov_0.849315_1_plen_65_part_00
MQCYDAPSCLDELCTLLGATLLTQLAIGNFVEFGLPWVQVLSPLSHRSILDAPSISTGHPSAIY